MRNYILELVVFICGSTVMVFEMVGSRVLAPFLGTSIIVWTSLIGIILASLSLGYWYGGRISDRQADMRVLSNIILLAGAIIGATTFVYSDLLLILDHRIHNLIVKSIMSVLLLFAAPGFLLGIVSPYAIRLKMKDLSDSGKTVGNLYALSTAGSIVGTFAAGFYLIPQFGTNRILIILSLLLFVCALASRPGASAKAKTTALLVPFVILFAGAVWQDRYASRDCVLDVDTQYGRVQICDEHAGTATPGNGPDGAIVRRMKINGSFSSSILVNSPDLYSMYARYFRLARHFNPDIRSSLMLGGAGYVYPRDYLSRYRHARIDVVEIDPRVTDIARTYFDLRDDSRLQIIHEDGRTYINNTKKKYDVVFNDSFSSRYSIPYQLTTAEAVRRMYDILNDNGVVLVNLISAIEGPAGEFLRAEYRTFRNTFPQVYLFPVETNRDGSVVQNIMLVALKKGGQAALESSNPELNGYLSHRWTGGISEDRPPLSDEYAPVDYYISKAIMS